MKIINLRDIPVSERIHTFEDSIRESFAVCLKGVFLTGRNIHYPNCLLVSEERYVNPYDERVMSLQKDSFYENDEYLGTEVSYTVRTGPVVTTPVFFFVYNVDNYYHFVYDSLPILAHYFTLKRTLPELQLLIATSHPSKKTLPLFVEEFLAKLGIPMYTLASVDTYYKTIYFGTSLTHGRKSNEAPSREAFGVWNSLTSTQTPPKRFYISRRSWIHGKTENMGTNYTLRRKCTNEDEVVALLATYGIEEIFTELLSTEQKLELFKNAEFVVGIIGGGTCNLLFSPPSTKSLLLTTPFFLDINGRFKYSMEHTQTYYSECASHIDSEQKYTLFSRVKVINTELRDYGCIGEVEEFRAGQYIVSVSSNDVAGFSQDFHFKKELFNEEDLLAIDNGLNSPFRIDIERLERDLKFHLDA